MPLNHRISYLVMASITESLFSNGLNQSWTPRNEDTWQCWPAELKKQIKCCQLGEKKQLNRVLPSGRKTLNQNFLLSKKLVSSEKNVKLRFSIKLRFINLRFDCTVFVQ